MSDCDNKINTQSNNLIECAKVIKEYCNQRKGCMSCEFYVHSVEWCGCALNNTPCHWEWEE